MTLRVPTPGAFKAGNQAPTATVFPGVVSAQHFTTTTLNNFPSVGFAGPNTRATATPTDGQWWPRTKSQ